KFEPCRQAQNPLLDKMNQPVKQQSLVEFTEKNDDLEQRDCVEVVDIEQEFKTACTQLRNELRIVHRFFFQHDCPRVSKYFIGEEGITAICDSDRGSALETKRSRCAGKYPAACAISGLNSVTVSWDSAMVCHPMCSSEILG